jgi:hypothetical protein
MAALRPDWRPECASDGLYKVLQPRRWPDSRSQAVIQRLGSAAGVGVIQVGQGRLVAN